MATTPHSSRSLSEGISIAHLKSEPQIAAVASVGSSTWTHPQPSVAIFLTLLQSRRDQSLFGFDMERAFKSAVPCFAQFGDRGRGGGFPVHPDFQLVRNRASDLFC